MFDNISILIELRENSAPSVQDLNSISKAKQLRRSFLFKLIGPFAVICSRRLKPVNPFHNSETSQQRVARSNSISDFSSSGEIPFLKC